MNRHRAFTRISRKNQAAIPVDALRQAGLKPGDELVRAVDLIERHAGKAPEVYPPSYLAELRDEWR